MSRRSVKHPIELDQFISAMDKKRSAAKSHIYTFSMEGGMEAAFYKYWEAVNPNLPASAIIRELMIVALSADLHEAIATSGRLEAYQHMKRFIVERQMAFLGEMRTLLGNSLEPKGEPMALNPLAPVNVEWRDR